MKFDVQQVLKANFKITFIKDLLKDKQFLTFGTLVCPPLPKKKTQGNLPFFERFELDVTDFISKRRLHS